jgi:hypothetical protein
MVVLKRLDDETGSRKFNMAAAKPYAPLPQLLCKIAEKFQRIPCVFGAGNSMLPLMMLYLETVRNSSWRQAKLDVAVSQLLYKIAKNFQRLSECFRGRRTHCRYREGSISKPEVRNSRWRPTNRKYLHLSFYAR